jgi:hypothetical protein
MDYLTTEKFDSKLVPGLSYQLRKMANGRRMALTSATSIIQQKINDRMGELEAITRQVQDAIDSGVELPTVIADQLSDRTEPVTETCRALMRSRDKIQFEEIWNDLTVTQLFPALIRWGVKSIDGMTVDGVPVTVEAFLEGTPDDLIIEVGTKIRKLTQMSFDEQMGFKLPGTSSTPVTGQPTNTSVHLVDRKDSLKEDGAESFTLTV